MDAANEPDVIVESRCLVDDRTPLEVADAARAAGLAFLNDVARGKARHDVKERLACWLVGPYRAATTTLPGVPPARLTPVPGGLRAAALDARTAQIVAEVRHHTLRALTHRPDGLVRLPVWARSTGSVLSSEHAGGARGYVAIDHPRMRLEDRVLSLFAVDALLRPSDYQEHLAICARCRSVSFEGRFGECDACVNERTRPISEIRHTTRELVSTEERAASQR